MNLRADEETEQYKETIKKIIFKEKVDATNPNKKGNKAFLI